MEDVLDAVSVPAWVTPGYRGALVAWRPLGRSRFLAVIYRERSASDGFVVTAFITRSAGREPEGMATRLTQQEIDRVVRSVPRLIDLPAKRFWVDYDEEADVLYVSFRKPQDATDSEMGDDGVIVHTRRGEVVGITILDASTRTA